MKILRHTYGRGFTVPIGGPNSYHTARIYRETTVEVEPDDDPVEVIEVVEQMVDSQVESDYNAAAGKNLVKDAEDVLPSNSGTK